MAKPFDPMSYAKNVVKSAGYITTETIKGVNPTLTSYITEGKNSAKEMYSNIRNYKTTVRTAVNNVLGDTGFDDLKRIKTNAFEDLRTGKFYNPEREGQFMEDYARKNGLSFDFDDEDLNISDDEVESDGTVSSAAINSLGDQLYKGQKDAANITASKILKGSKKNTAAQIAHSEKMFNQINISLVSINSSILSLHQDLATPINTHIINSMNFYQAATTELAKQTSLLENINKMLTDRFAPPKGYGNQNKRTVWEEVMGYSGIPSLRNWAKVAKNKAIQDSGLDAFASIMDPEMMQMAIQMAGSSPIAFVLTQIMSDRIANGKVGKALNRTVGSLRGGINHAAIRVSRYAREHKNDNTFKAFLARAFDILPQGKAKMDFSKYNQGRAEWTGRDSKALQEVIPTQLAEILSAITGKEAKIFDYKTGKFMTTRKVREKFQKDRASAVGAASAGFRNDVIDEFITQDREMNPNAAELNRDSKAVRNLSKTYDSLMSLLSINGVDVSRFNNAASLVSFCRSRGWVGNDRSSTGSRAYILDETSLRRLAKVLYSRRVGGMTGRFEDAVVTSGIANRNFVADSANSSFGNLANGSNLSSAAQNTIFAAEDKSGRNIFFYLQNYYDQLQTIVDHMSAGGVTGNRRDTTNVSSRGSRNNTVTRVPVVVSSGRSSNTRAQSGTPSFGGTDYVPLSDEDRYEYNRETEEYEAPRQRASSRATRDNNEKNSIFVRGINKVNEYIDKIFYGTAAGENGEIRHYGIAGLMKDLSSDLRGTISSAMENAKNFFTKLWTGLKEKDGFKKYVGYMKDSVKGFAKSVWGDAKEKAARGYEFFKGKRPSWAAEVAEPTGSRRGGYVSKSGMVSVSEGEMIVPADQNPWYTGHMGNAARDSIESSNYRKWSKAGSPGGEFWGMFRRGRTPESDSQWHRLTNEEKRTIRQMASEGQTAEEIAKKVGKPIGQVKQVIGGYNVTGTANVVKEEAQDTWKRFKNSKVGQGAFNIAEDILGRLNAGIEHLVGDPEKYKNAKDIGKEAIDVAKNNLPKTFAGGTLGALVGAAVTGSGMGLLGGLVIGAGTSIINNSDEISRKLFGEKDADGNYSGGMLGPKVSNFIKKRMPKIAKSGALGGVLGTLGLAPGGIFGGLAIGAGLELVSTTDTFKNIMFGHEDVNGQRNGGLMGSLKVNVVDPLINFTKGGLQKISEYIKTNFLQPVTKIFDPLKDWVKGKSRRFMDDIAAKAKETVKRTLGEKFDAIFKPITTGIGKAGKWALGAAGKVASAPFRFVGNTLGGALEQHNIRKGYSSKSAAERMEMEGASTKGLLGLIGKGVRKIPGMEDSTFGTVHNTSYTKWAANASDEDVQAAEHYMNGAVSFKRGIIKKRQDLANLVTASLVNGGAGNPRVVKEIKGLFNTDKVRKENDFSEVISYIEGLDESLMGPDTKSLVIEQINESRESIGSDKQKFSTFDQDREDFFNRIGLTDAKARKKFIKQGRIQSQFDAAGIRKASGMAQDEALRKAKSKDEAAKLLREQEEASPIDTKRNNLLTDIRELVAGIAKKSGVPATNTSSPTPLSDSGMPLSLPPHNANPNFEDNPPEAEDGAVKSGEYNGKPIQLVYRESERKWVPNMNDADTKRVVDADEADNKTRNKFYNTFVGGGLLASLKGLFNPKEDEGKGTLWDKIKSMFGGTGGILGKILLAVGGLKLFFSTDLPQILTKALTEAIPKILESIKNLFKNGTDNTAGSQYDPEMRSGSDAEARKEEVKGWTGVKGFFKKTKLLADSIENRLTGKDMTTYAEDDFVTENTSDRYLGRIGKNALIGMNPKLAGRAAKFAKNTIGKIPVVGKVLAAPLNIASKLPNNLTKLGSKVANSKIGVKAIEGLKSVGTKLSGTKAATKVLDVAKSAGSKLSANATKIFSTVKASSVGKAAKEVANSKTVTKLAEILSSIFNTLTSALGLKASKEVVEKAVQEGAEELGKAAAKGSAKATGKLSEAIPVIGQAIYLGFIANAVIEGFQDAKAKTILGIVETPTIPQRVLAAACNGLNEAVPGIGGIIPTETIFGIMFTLLESLGLDLGKLAEQRAAARAELAQYNEEHHTTYNMEEYLHNEKGEYTIQDKIKTGIKNIFSSKKEASTAGSGTKLINTSAVNANVTKLNEMTTGFTGNVKANRNRRNDKSSSRTSTGRGSGVHTSQKGNSRPFGNTTIDENGCGPAVASTVLKAYGRGVGINDAAAYAERGGYVAGSSGVGTRASYFEDILGRNGISTSYSDKQSDIKNAVNSGRPTILLGQDKGNRSKANSPFGPNPHYVVTRGTDGNGNVIVDDPELNGTTVYKKSILNKAKLGVATGGAAGVDGLISDTIGGIFNKAIDKLGDTGAGKILKFIFGRSDSGEEESRADANGSFSGTPLTPTSGMGVVSYGNNDIFKIATSAPNSSDPYINLYNNSSNKGISNCVTGSPADSICNVLANCVGWACARFNHIYNLLTGNKGIAFPGFSCNAEKFIEVAKSYGLTVGTEPQVGAIMCWQKGPTLTGIDGAGHVAIVEQVISADEVLTSESGYKAKQKFWNEHRKKGNGNWGQASAYKFRGFIYNPAVAAKTAPSTTTVLSGNGGHETIWKYLKKKGLTDAAAAGVMGCWEEESHNLTNRVEGDYTKSYPGSSTVMATKASLNDWTNRLFNIYANNDPPISINKDAYKGEDGNYYPGIGLAQWTGPRAYRLIKFAEASGKSFSDPAVQLDYFWNEFSNRKGLAYKLNQAKTPEEAATIFLDGFEMNEGWHNTTAGQKQNAIRQKHAKSIYAKYQGVKASLGRGSGITNLTGVPTGNYTAGDSKLLENVNKFRQTASGSTMRTAARNGNRTPVTTYNFTDGRNSYGSGTRMNYQTGSASKMESYIKEINQILLYLKQLVTNTAYNASIPTLVDVMNQGVELLAQIGSFKSGSSSQTAAETDFATGINDSINLMKKKLEAVAQTL